MSLQYTYDSNGKPVGIFVPIEEWKKITNNEEKTIMNLRRKSSSKEKILNSIEKGMKQVSKIEKGKLKSISLNELLNAL